MSTYVQLYPAPEQLSQSGRRTGLTRRLKLAVTTCPPRVSSCMDFALPASCAAPGCCSWLNALSALRFSCTTYPATQHSHHSSLVHDSSTPRVAEHGHVGAGRGAQRQGCTTDRYADCVAHCRILLMTLRVQQNAFVHGGRTSIYADAQHIAPRALAEYSAISEEKDMHSQRR